LYATIIAKAETIAIKRLGIIRTLEYYISLDSQYENSITINTLSLESELFAPPVDKPLDGSGPPLPKITHNS
jgi:hypothetical protein